MPFVAIENITIIRANLEVLARFDGHRGLGGVGALKLNINATGVFSAEDGYFQAMFKRWGESLLNEDTIRTIRTMFENAVKHMKTDPHPDKKRDETRKLLVRGFRGLAYLSYHGYRNR